MAISEKLIFILDKYEQAAFRESLRKGKSNRDIQLFDAVIKYPNATPNDLMTKLYGGPNRPAYKSTQTRLTDKLRGYLFQLSGGVVATSEMYHDLAVGGLLIKRMAWSEALHFLSRAEEQARIARSYEALENIYCTMLSEAVNLGLKPQQVFDKWQENRRRLDAMVHLNVVFNEVSYKHAEAKRIGTVLDKEAVLNEALNVVELTPEKANDPVYMFRFMTLVRNVATSNKIYQQFERSLARIYGGLKRINAFQEADADLELQFQFMLSHAQYRNARLDDALDTLALAKSISRRLPFVAVKTVRKLIALEGAILNVTGRVKLAIPLLEKALSKRGKYETDKELLNIQMNLIAYLYNAREYKKAVQVLESFPYDRPTLGQLMGAEWLFKLDMFELISYYDRSMYDKAEAQLNKIRQQYDTLFQTEVYARVKVYLGFVERMIADPFIVEEPEFREDVRNARLNLSQGDEDIQAIAFHCWITCKIFKRDYYETLLYAIGWKGGVVC
jgi:tetratricopeptide (TPR) repeat protein